MIIRVVIFTMLFDFSTTSVAIPQEVPTRLDYIDRWEIGTVQIASLESVSGSSQQCYVSVLRALNLLESNNK